MTDRRQHCFNCGEDIGPSGRFSEPLDTCGREECEREARNAAADYAYERHAELDRDMGYY